MNYYLLIFFLSLVFGNISYEEQQLLQEIALCIIKKGIDHTQFENNLLKLRTSSVQQPPLELLSFTDGNDIVDQSWFLQPKTTRDLAAYSLLRQRYQIELGKNILFGNLDPKFIQAKIEYKLGDPTLWTNRNQQSAGLLRQYKNTLESQRQLSEIIKNTRQLKERITATILEKINY